MSSTSPDSWKYHPGLICIFAAFPVTLIVLILLVILKGFNLFPTVQSRDPRKWTCWSKLIGRGPKEGDIA